MTDYYLEPREEHRQHVRYFFAKKIKSQKILEELAESGFVQSKRYQVLDDLPWEAVDEYWDMLRDYYFKVGLEKLAAHICSSVDDKEAYKRLYSFVERNRIIGLGSGEISFDE